MKRKNEIPDFSKKKQKGPRQQPHGVPDLTKVQQPPPAPTVRSEISRSVGGGPSGESTRGFSLMGAVMSTNLWVAAARAGAGSG